MFLCCCVQELVVELLSQGADISTYSADGNNCLHFAAINDRKGIVEILLRSGADPSIPNKTGILPVELTKAPSVRELFLRDRSAIFSPIVQTRMLLSDYIEQMNLNNTSHTTNTVPADVVADKADNTDPSNTNTKAAPPTEHEEVVQTENTSRKTVFNMADELDDADSPNKSDLMLSIPPPPADDDGTYIVGVATPAVYRQHSSLDK